MSRIVVLWMVVLLEVEMVVRGVAMGSELRDPMSLVLLEVIGWLLLPFREREAVIEPLAKRLHVDPLLMTPSLVGLLCLHRVAYLKL